MDETVNITDDLIKQHLKDNKICFSQPPWILKTSSLGGRGVFTSRPVKAGEILFIDTPLIIGPRAGVDSPKLCVVCYKNYDLKLCSKNCGILICSNECQESEVHKKECELILKWKIEKNEEENEDILRFLTPVRSLFLSGYQKKLVKVLKGHIDPKHGFEVDSLKLLGFVFEEEEENFLRLICSILDANAFAVSVGNETNQASLRGLYPLASLANHRCYPNVTHVFDSKQRMITKAVVDMEEGTEIFHSYTRIIWSTIVRRYNLVNTKHFCCYCERCEDPSEFGTDLSAIFCNRCKGKMLPVEPLSFKTRWKCRDCSHYLEQSDAKLVMSILGSALARFVPDDDVEKMLNFIEEKTKNAIPVTNQIIVEIKYKLVWILGYKEPYTWNELSDEKLKKKENICRDLLALLSSLKTGLNKMRGLLLYELFCCLRERKKRSITKKNENQENEETEDLEGYLREASEILEFDVNAPEEIKLMWKSEHLYAENCNGLQ